MTQASVSTRPRGRRLIRLVAGIAAVSILATACGSDDEGGSSGSGGEGAEATAEPFRVLALVPASGALAAIGEAGSNGLRAAQDVINAEGGILGRQVEIEFRDTEGDPTTAVSVLRDAAASGTTYDLVVAGVSSGETVPMLPVLTQNKLLAIQGTASAVINDPAKWPTVFSVTVDSREVARSMVDQLEEQGIEKAAGLFPDTETGHVVSEALIPAAEDAGIDFEAAYIDPTSIDATADLARLQAGNPEALVLTSFFGPIATVVLESRARLGWTINTLGDATFATNDFGAIAPANLEGITVVPAGPAVAGSEVTETEAFTQYAEAIKKYVPDADYTIALYALPYQALMMARAGAEAAGSTDAEEVAAALETFEAADDVKGWFWTKNIGYDSESHFPDFTGSFSLVTPGAQDELGLMVAEGQ